MQYVYSDAQLSLTLNQFLAQSWTDKPIYVSRLSARKQLTLPTIEQRRRVLELLSTLSPHHTAECTRSSQPLYVQQVRERYQSLVGLRPTSQTSWLSSFDFGSFGDSQHVHLAPEKEHKYFFAINLYNSFDIIPDLFATLFRVSAILGYHNVYVSIYENGSTDQTKALLRIFDALTKSVGLRVTIRTSTRTRGAFNHRIEYLAEVRNQAFNPLHELRDSHNEYFDTIIFMNDILPCVDDILELIWQSRRQNAGITCAADYMYHEELVGFSTVLRCNDRFLIEVTA
jgi:alpha-1,3-mannosyltransferase